ncbi:MAG: hypothetical protein A2622_04095 [Bdellovibrionales bacterium RIFCSPHIGHO2_01_FULL_40_29]|nr:MAG: hypothetical protein A2622_04095 [Bdellovibrionales bacterium RIFCSPHIGHO2_01_FULL_40_29]OFZ34880.1 MAG: hypothetical protein A3D17_11280 [Bdellovibrionales bacterium RIFCSPHIGHO2_02_FULL_40_15]
MSQFNDDQLKALLQKNQPKAPSAEDGEFSQILARAKTIEKSRFKLQWVGLGSAIAASFLAFWISIQQPNELQDIAMPTEQISDDFDLYNEEWPTMDVGEDFIELASNN